MTQTPHSLDTQALADTVVQTHDAHGRLMAALLTLSERLDRLEARLERLEHKAGPDRMWPQSHPQASGGHEKSPDSGRDFMLDN